MGLYTYECEKCGQLNLELKMSEIPIKECPLCGTPNPTRVFVPVETIWKCNGAFGKSDSLYHMLEDNKKG